MDTAPTIIAAVYQYSHYAPLVIFVAATLDIFFLTGFLFYGAAMMSTTLMLHVTGMISTPALLLAALGGTLFGNGLNFLIGRWFGETRYIKQQLAHPRVARAQELLRTRGLLLFMTIGRFITFTRPLYALFLGSLHITARRFFVREIPLALFWVSVWLIILLESEVVYRWLTQ